MKKLFFLFLLVFTGMVTWSQNPGSFWMQYATPEEAGWSKEKLETARQYAESINSAAFMLVYQGKVVTSWGEIERRFMCHSIRKSFLSALYGIYVDSNKVDLDKTMGQLGIDDVHHLTDLEKTATIRDLLKARSGVYHPAAYETDAMKRARPERGSHAPNTFWYYNNWDFNTLRNILEMHSHVDFFQDFKKRIADPLRMQDFRLEDCYYHLESEHSMYPAYPFRMSARDMARFGQLFLQNGRWNDRQVVPANWVKESTTTYSHDTRAPGRGYAYLWWTNMYGDTPANYSAQGVGNQAIIVYPGQDIVMVNRANTFKGENVATDSLLKLTRLVLAARQGPAKPNPRFITLKNENHPYVGDYIVDDQVFHIGLEGSGLYLQNPSGGRFNLVKAGKHRFLLEDAQYFFQLLTDEQGNLTGKASLER